jgi:hypothetical protein
MKSWRHEIYASSGGIPSPALDSNIKTTTMLQDTLLFEQAYNIFDSIIEIAIVCPVLSADTKAPWDSSYGIRDHVALLVTFTLRFRHFSSRSKEPDTYHADTLSISRSGKRFSRVVGRTRHFNSA